MIGGRLVISLGVAPLVGAALLFSTAASGATAIVSVSINGSADSETTAATASAQATTGGPAAIGVATASADAPTGTLRARTDGASAEALGGFLDADASAEITESLFLIPEEGSPSSPVPFTIFLDLDGTLDVSGIGVVGSSSLQLVSARSSAVLDISGFAASGISNASFTVSRLAQVASGIVQSDDTTVLLQQNTSGSVETGFFDVRLTANAMVTPNSAFTVRAVVIAESAADAGFQSSSDMADTGRLGVVVPDGYSLVSSSGSFLTAPEPHSPAAAALGALGALIALRESARRRAASGR